jgi:hypothetical protein
MCKVSLSLFLLHELSNYGIGGTVISWIESFLKIRTQVVVIEGETSTCVLVESGVPLK